MIHKGTYDGTIYHNPANRFCIISVKTADKEVPLEARSTRRYRDHLIRFVATGYELPRTDAVELELDGEWKQGKYGMQFQVEQWRQIVPRTKSGVEGYLASGLIVLMISSEKSASRMKRTERMLSFTGSSASMPALRPKFLNSCHTQLSKIRPTARATKIPYIVSAAGK